MQPPLLLESQLCQSQRNEPKSLERTKAGVLLAAGLPALRVAVLARSTAEGQQPNFSDNLQLCELRVEVRPGKAVFIIVRLQLVRCCFYTSEAFLLKNQAGVLTCRSCGLGLLKYLAQT